METPSQDPPGFFQRFGVWIAVGVVAVLGGGAWMVFAPKEKPKKKANVSMVSVMPPLPPPPPPPTPPPTPPPQEQQPPPDNPQQPEFQEEKQPDSPPQQAKAEPDEPAPMGSNIQGEGSDGFGLRGNGNGGMIGGKGAGGGGGTKWGWYAGQVQSRVMDALSRHKRTRSAAMNIKVRIWADNSGRITRAVLSGTTGDPAVDQAIQNEILTGLQLQEPPPADMPMPIVMRISAKRPQ